MAHTLIIDNAPMIREPLMLALKSWGYSVAGASNCNEAWEEIERAAPDLIVIEPDLGDQDGFRLLKRLTDEGHLPDVAIIILTQNSDRSRVITAGQLGIRHYLLKTGFDLEQFKLRAELGLRRAGRDAPSQATASGSPDEAAPRALPKTMDEIEPAITKERAIESIRSFGQCRALSPTFKYAMKLLNDSRASIEQIAASLKRDHALAVRVLKAANGAAYNRGRPVHTVEQAAVRIGMSELRNIVMSVAVMDQFGGEEFEGLIDITSFWEHAIATAMFCQELARETRSMDPEKAFLVGLLHDVGRVVMIEQFGKRYADCLDTARSIGRPLHLVEKRCFHLDHTDVAASVFGAWHFPETLAAPVASHHLSFANLKHLNPGLIPITGTLILADRLADASIFGSSGELWLTPFDEAARAIGLSENAFERVMNRVPQIVTELKLGLAAASNLAPAPSYADLARERLGHELHARMINNSKRPHPAAIFLGKIQDASDPEPNLLCIPWDATSQAPELLAEMESADEEAGRRLPALVVHESGDAPPDTLTADRDARTVKLPERAEKILELISDLLAAELDEDSAEGSAELRADAA